MRQKKDHQKAKDQSLISRDFARSHSNTAQSFAADEGLYEMEHILGVSDQDILDHVSDDVHDNDLREDVVSDIFSFKQLSEDEDADLFGISYAGSQNDFYIQDRDFERLLIDFTDLIALSPSAQKLCDHASYHGYEFAFANLGNEGYELVERAEEDDPNLIYLDVFSLQTEALIRSEHYRDAVFLNLVRAMRDIYHETSIGNIYALYQVEDLLKIERARVADIEAMTAQIAWELRANTKKDRIWRNLIGQEDGDIAISFWQALEERPSALFDGRAMARGFKQWYTAQNRSDACDRDALDYLDSILKRAKNYNPFGKHKITAGVFESLFTTCLGRRYICGWGDTILKDPFYAGMADGYNQAHLFQMMQDIKITVVENVPFNDPVLALRIFPQEDSLI